MCGVRCICVVLYLFYVYVVWLCVWFVLCIWCMCMSLVQGSVCIMPELCYCVCVFCVVLCMVVCKCYIQFILQMCVWLFWLLCVFVILFMCDCLGCVVHVNIWVCSVCSCLGCVRCM